MKAWTGRHLSTIPEHQRIYSTSKPDIKQPNLPKISKPVSSEHFALSNYQLPWSVQLVFPAHKLPDSTTQLKHNVYSDRGRKTFEWARGGKWSHVGAVVFIYEIPIRTHIYSAACGFVTWPTANIYLKNCCSDWCTVHTWGSNPRYTVLAE